MPNELNESLGLDKITVNGYEFEITDTSARTDIDEISGAITLNNASISARINDLNDRAFDDTISISSNNETEISSIDDGVYKLRYVTIETVQGETVETLNNLAILIQIGNNQYLYKNGQLSNRTKENNAWGNWSVFAGNVTSVNGQTGAVTVAGLPTVTSSDNGKILMVINGQWQLVSPSVLYNGSGVPNNAQGNNGDIYVQTGGNE